MEQGYFQIFTGDGKGKTTAALGLAMRASGAGLKVYIGQFIKSMEYHEVAVIRKRFPEIKLQLYGIEGCIIDRDPDQCDIKAARDGYSKAMAAVKSGSYDLVILDEITIAIYFKLISAEEALTLAAQRSPGTELVFTGRYAPKELIDAADLVTEMKEIKHYYSKGIEARDGIER